MDYTEGKGPEEDNLKGSNPSPENDSSKNTGSPKAHQKPLDWREFRASLYIQELVWFMDYFRKCVNHLII